MRERKIHVWEMPNGFRVYTYHDNTNRVSGVGAAVGSLYDPRGYRGMSHLYEHLIARQTRDIGNREFDLLHAKYLGGPDDDVNIRTDFVSTFYGHAGLMRLDHMLKVFDAMAGFVRDRLIDQEAFDIERAAVLQETYLRGLDTLDDRINQLVYRTLYTSNPVRNRIDCEPDELETFLLSKARQFGRRYYVPRNMFMVMLGPPHKQALRLAEKYFGEMEDRGTPRLDYDHTDDVPVLADIRSVEEGFPGIRQHHVTVAWPTETFSSKDGIALDVLSSVLQLRLTWRLREGNRDPKAGAYRTPVETERTFVHGLLEAKFATTDPEFAKHGYDVILQEAQRLRTELVAIDEFDAVTTYPELCWLDAFRFNGATLCEMIIEAVANGDEDCESVHSFQDELRTLNRRKLRDVANKYLTPEHVKVVVGPA